MATALLIPYLLGEAYLHLGTPKHRPPGTPLSPAQTLSSTPPLGSSDSAGWSDGSSKDPVRRTRDLTSAGTSPLPVAAWPPDPNPRSPAPQATLSSSLDSVATAGHPANASATHFSTPPSRSTRSVATPPGLTVLRALSGTPNSSYPALTPSAQHGAPGWNTPGIATSNTLRHGAGAGSKASTDYTFPGKAGGSFSSSSLPVNPTVKSEGSDHLQASRDSALSDAAQGIHLLLNPPEMLAPSQGPFIRPHTTSRAAPEPTMVPHEEFYPTHTMDDDWGSGDYLETMSFMGPEGEEFSLVTSLPTDMYDLEDSGTEVYDTSFPLQSSRPSSVTSQSGLDEGSDLDWADTYTIEPTEILLPDMNSLEYYTTLLAKEKRQRGRTQPHFFGARLLPTALANGSGVEESSADGSGSGAPNFTASDTGGIVRPHLVNGSEPALEPSVSPTLSTSLWGRQVSSTVRMHTVPAPLPGATSSSASVRPAASQQPDGQWIISATSTETVLRPTASATTHATPALTTSARSPAGTSPSPAMADQGATSEAATTVAERRRTTTKTVETASTVSSGRTTTTSGPLIVTSRTPLTTSARQYLCNITRPETYLVRVDLPTGFTVGYAKSHIREILKSEFNRSVDLQILKSPSDFVFRVCRALWFTRRSQ
ncbi:hypothetical protein SKAU_G00048100 [Synaphobranchus kaupii]|uniref:Uncharacterized protein n=1 Tax=Synaphobranchus kaupii TaxID=118154 RepID=A0A9Q1G2L5_SYNKA|nr:hypothetical protein SKAU_G00048100 [Synaphobranchus kaupii]